ncbi:hypothetical protein DER45DRAFT_611847 [Fusarium avenaceum]|nr:hypothetical protein DER45DRAFT_611847 [Fusarium avenaceum]
MSPQDDMTGDTGNLDYDSCEDRFPTPSQGELDSISSHEVPVQLIAFIERPARDDPFSTWSMSDTAYPSVFPFQYIEFVWLLRVSALVEYCDAAGIQNRMTGAHTINTIDTGHDLYGIGAQFESSHD